LRQKEALGLITQTGCDYNEKKTIPLIDVVRFLIYLIPSIRLFNNKIKIIKKNVLSN